MVLEHLLSKMSPSTSSESNTNTKKDEKSVSSQHQPPIDASTTATLASPKRKKITFEPFDSPSVDYVSLKSITSSQYARKIYTSQYVH